MKWAGVIIFFSVLFNSIPGICQHDYIYQTNLITIYYNDRSVLLRFKERIKPDAMALAIDNILLGEELNPDEELKRYVDKLFQKVQLILDMPRPKLKIKMRLFSEYDDLMKVYNKYTKGKGASPPAFFMESENTIFINVRAVTRGILAHEMAHAVISDYFIIDPPSNVAEILCRYVDKKISGQSFQRFPGKRRY